MMVQRCHQILASSRCAVDKGQAELRYWQDRRQTEGRFKNDWYEPHFTRHFGLTRDDYAGQRVLDIGCGPRGSLEWASMALERVGLDPLAELYQGLNGGRQAMTYVTAP